MTMPKAIHPARYRVSQFFIALKAYLPTWAGGLPRRLLADDDSLIKSVLSTPGQQRLFNRMPPNDQRHAIAVTCTLRQAGCNHRALMQAALLHDVGKSMGQPIIHRVLIVLFNAFWPAALKWLSTFEQDTNAQLAPVDLLVTPSVMVDPSDAICLIEWWRRPFVVHAQHPAIGAARAQKVGCDPLAVKLIFRHQDALTDESTEEQKMLAALQWADNLN